MNAGFLVLFVPSPFTRTSNRRGCNNYGRSRFEQNSLNEAVKPLNSHNSSRLFLWSTSTYSLHSMDSCHQQLVKSSFFHLDWSFDYFQYSIGKIFSIPIYTCILYVQNSSLWLIVHILTSHCKALLHFTTCCSGYSHNYI